MERAIGLAARHRPHPNPRVGAVVLDEDGAVVGEGAHITPGTPHAERHALDAAGDRAAGGTIVVTLEPCSHHGRTGPCADAIIDAGVRRVVAAIPDPDARVAGSGFARLRDGGVEVIVGVLAAAAEALDPGYLTHRRLGRPRVVAVIVSTLDGQVADLAGEPAAELLGPDALEDLACLRGEFDTVLIGSGYVGRLRPSLDAGPGPGPAVAVISGRRSPRVDRGSFARPPLVFSPEQGLSGTDAEIVADGTGRVDLDAALRTIAERGSLDVLVEGGHALTTALAGAGLVDRYVIYLAGRLAGGVGRSPFDGTMTTMGDARRVIIDGVRQFANDLRIDVQIEET
jgi:diaminohydroxyphosphoribosylaminopyrimidine deaminase/5-amino-6-(5-phosphoribosylamino)uracil reductase